MHPKYLFDIQVKYPPRDERSGDWAGLQKGIGYELWGLRKYSSGDSYRHIDWKARARTGELYVKEFSRDSAFTLLLMCDVSPSMHFGKKMSLMTDVAASLAHAALRNQNPCALLLFADEVIRFLPPSADPAQLCLVLDALEKAADVASRRTLLQPAFRFVKHRMRSCFGVILSDFHFPLEGLSTCSEARSAVHWRVPAHEMVAFHLLESLEIGIDDFRDGAFWVRDAESGEARYMDLNGWERYNQALKRGLERNVRILAENAIDSLVLEVRSQDVQKKVNTFFHRRISTRL